MVYSGSYSFLKEQLKRHIKKIYENHHQGKIPKITFVVHSNEMKRFLKEYLTQELGILVNTEFFTMIDISKKITNIEPLQDFDKEMILNKFLIEKGYFSDGLAYEFNLVLQYLKVYKIPFESVKSQFVKDVINNYESFKKENNYFDREDVHKLAVQTPTNFKTDYLILFGIRTVPDLYADLIRKLKQLSSQIDIFIQLIENSGYIKNHKHFEEIIDFYKQVGGNIGKETINQDPNLTVSLNIYNDNYNLPKISTENIKILSSKNEKEELENIIQLILDLKKSGVEWYEIGIIISDINKYIPYIKEIFKKYHIPYYLSEENRFIDNPIYQKLYSIFEVKIKNFTKESVLNILSEKLLNIENISSLEEEILQYSISEGFEDWENFNLNKNFLDFLKLLNSIPEEAEIFEFIQIFEKINEIYLKDEELKEFLGIILEELKDRGLYKLLFSKISYENFAKIVKLFFEQENKENRIKGNTISILKPHISEGNNFKYIFFLNLNEGSYPNPTKEEILINSEELNNFDYPYHLLMQELVSFCSVFDRDKKVYLSYIEESLSGKEELPSIFLEEVKRILYPEKYLNNEKNDKKVEKKYWTLKDFYVVYSKYIADFDKKLKNLIEKKRKNESLSLNDFILSFVNLKFPLSATKFQKYYQCPYKFFLEEIINIEGLEELDRTALSPLEKGILVHNILEKFYKNLEIEKISNVDKFVELQREDLRRQFYDEEKGINYMLELLLPSYRPFEKAQVDLMFERLISFLKEDILYLKKNQKNVDKDLLEKYLPDTKRIDQKILKDEEKKAKYYIGDFIGRIDRADKDNTGNYYVYDYKTGEKAVERIEKEILSKYIQLLIYKRFLEAEGKTVKKVGILAVNSKDEKFRHEIDSKNLESGYKILDNALGKLKERYFPPIENEYCKYCQFEQFCIKNVDFSFEQEL